MSHTESLPVTDRSRVRRGARLAHHDRAIINAILDEALVVQVGFVVENQPFVIPMGFGREDDVLYLHGANASRMMKNLAQGIDICVSATLLDGIVIARSLFHHAMNYRSVVLFGQATLVQDEAEKMHALKVLSEHITPGQWDYARTPTPKKSKAPRCSPSRSQRDPPKFAAVTPMTMPMITRSRSGPDNCPSNSRQAHPSLIPNWPRILPSQRT